MATRGYPDYEPWTFSDGPLVSRRYDTLSRAEVEAAPFVRPRAPGNVASSSERAMLQRTEQDPQFSIALVGPEDKPGGCSDSARDEVFGASRPLDVLAETTTEYSNEVLDRVRADPSVAAANEAWSACMATSGFAFATRDAMASVAAPGYPDVTRLATTDWDCRASTGYPEKYRAAWNAAYDDVTDEHALEIREMLDAVTAQIKKILG